MSGFGFPLCPCGPDWRLNWDDLCKELSWLEPMAAVEQDPIVHAEGDVLTHTRHVCDALVASDRWRNLGEMDRTELFLGALLHDIGKALCTRVEADGRVTSRGHGRKGARIARQILLDWPSHWGGPPPFAQRERIVNLIAFHSLPLHALDDHNGLTRTFEASLSLRCDCLADLAEADVLGRQCPDRNDILDRIELFRELCREHDCADKPKAFASDHTRFVYFRDPRRSPDIEAYDDTLSKVILMSGLPATGKDHYLRTYAMDLPTISLDAIRQELGVNPNDNQGRVVRKAKERARCLLRQNTSFAWNATNTTRAMRRQLIDLFTAYGARVHLVYTETDLGLLWKRNTDRSDSVPTDVIYRLLSRLDVPTPIEAHRLTFQVEQ